MYAINNITINLNILLLNKSFIIVGNLGCNLGPYIAKKRANIP